MNWRVKAETSWSNIVDKHLMISRGRIVKFEFWNVNCHVINIVQFGSKVKWNMTPFILKLLLVSFWSSLPYYLLHLPLFDVKSLPTNKTVFFELPWVILIFWQKYIEYFFTIQKGFIAYLTIFNNLHNNANII